MLSEAEKQKYLAFWRDYMGNVKTLSDKPFETLQRTIDGIVADGGRVVLVDLPIPPWHAQGAVLAGDYARRTAPLFSQLQTRPGVSVVAAIDSAETDFSDEVHPKPRVTERWAQRLATAVTTRPGLALTTRSASAQ